MGSNINVLEDMFFFVVLVLSVVVYGLVQRKLLGFGKMYEKRSIYFTSIIFDYVI